jgi:para-nitrobenzyl esterase
MVAYWSSFVRTGKPAVTGQPEWKTFGSSMQALRLRPGDVRMFDVASAHQCPLWQRLYPEVLSY